MLAGRSVYEIQGLAEPIGIEKGEMSRAVDLPIADFCFIRAMIPHQAVRLRALRRHKIERRRFLLSLITGAASDPKIEASLRRGEILAACWRHRSVSHAMNLQDVER